MRSRLSLKFIILVVSILALTLVTSAYVFLDRQQRLLQEQLIERGRILGHFVSLISSEAILAYDFVALESYIRDVSHRQDIVFGVILDVQGKPLTSYIDHKNPQVEAFESAKGQPFSNVLELLRAANSSSGIFIEEFPINEHQRKLGSVVVGISRERLEEELRDNFIRQIQVYSAIILFLSIAIYLVFRSSVMRPIRELISGARRVADGRYDEPVRVVRDDELGRLTEAFNHMMEDVRQDQELLSYQANYDHLTGLPNRLQAMERLKGEIARAKREQRRFAVIFIDLDNFKFVNDTMGHVVGDTLLVAMSERFSSVLRESDTIARLGGDEFLVMLPTASEVPQIKDAAQRLLATLATPLQLGEREVFLRCSMGIAVYPDDGASCEMLMANADNAMYQAKLSHTEQFRFFAPEMNVAIQERMTLEHDLHLALDNEEFELYYQPIIDLKSRCLVGSEALLRWNHPKKGLITPPTFIPLAESTGRIGPIGHWVLRRAAQDTVQLLNEGLEPGFVSVNVSRVQLTRGFEALVEAAFNDAQLPAERLRLEVTESALMEHIGELPEMLRRLDALGVNLVLDDFGTGFSSLNYLKHFPFHSLKIDKSFIDGIPGDDGDVSLVRGIIAMSQSLGLKVVAEGVETEEQYDFLGSTDVDYLQGFLFAKPMPLTDLRRYLQQQTAAREINAE